ncbi:hypothetical protein ACE6H2_004861 [Prunus campanulata]
MVSVLLGSDEQGRGGREEDTDWTMESNIIFFTDLLFAGNTDAIFGFFFIAFSGSGLTDDIFLTWVAQFYHQYALFCICAVVFMCLISCKNLSL